MNRKIAEQLRIAADIEEGKAPYGWDYLCKSNGAWVTAPNNVTPMDFLSCEGTLRIRHKWQKEKDAYYKQGKAIRQIGGCDVVRFFNLQGTDPIIDWDSPNIRFEIIEDEVRPPLTFPTPPEGEELVTGGLTPEQFEVDEDWRPLLKSEYPPELKGLKGNVDLHGFNSQDVWIAAYGINSFEKALRDRQPYRTREPFPTNAREPLTPGDGRVLHNPDNLTAKQVGKGYRLLLLEEVNCEDRDKIEMWMANDRKWVTQTYAASPTKTFRVPASIPWPAPPKEPEYVPLEMEDWFKDGPWMITLYGITFHLVTSISSNRLVIDGRNCGFKEFLNTKRRNFAGREELCRKVKV